ncbi:DNA methyltransferase [Kovacikia minuta CCNUW1]|uniref:type ISP restriction/modification enzyme n=1 Tax=Kovacikia minuta TaxID=2931930 RepID=UPI001CCADF3A|nr:type ISP restriction/modification enzyme [Kovacikia minuta]UBF26372.1 DNA methyltransferase [Kovacikia minuta CCNUW1]
MSKAKIFYFTLQDEQTKEEKLDWFERTRFEHIPFDNITPDQKANWINLTNNDFDSFLPLIDKEVKIGKSQEAIFQLFSAAVKTQRDEWVYDFSKDALIERMSYFADTYQERLENNVVRELDIKWDRELDNHLKRSVIKKFDSLSIVSALYRPFVSMSFYFDKHFNGVTYQLPSLFPASQDKNFVICCTDAGSQKPFMTIASNKIPDIHVVGAACSAQCLPLYRYDENGNRIDNITNWGLTQFQTHYNAPTITKEAIFHYTYAVLHHPAYRTKYELNLKREFPRLPFYADFHQWATWGKALMDLHLNYETIEPYGLRRVDIATTRRKGGSSQTIDDQPTLFEQDPPLQNPSDTTKPIKRTTPKAKLKADKTEGKIILDTETTLEGIPAVAWDYKLGNRSALEWILDQYKEKKPKDPTIAKLFNTYRFADYKEHVIDLLQRVCTVSVRTMEIIQQMPDTVEHKGG